MVKRQFRLGERSAHAWDHWERVEKYGVFLSRESGADEEVVRLFALLHDSQRRQLRPIFEQHHFGHWPARQTPLEQPSTLS